MLNAILLNTGMLNSGTPTPFALSAEDYSNIQFEDFSLQDDEHISSVIDAWSPPKRQLVTFPIPRADGGGWNGDYFREREVIVSGIMEQATAELMNTHIDEFKRAMTVSQGFLYLKVNDEVRRIVATLQNPQDMFKRREGYHISFVPYDLNFLALEPMWHGIEYEATTIEDVTSLSYPSEVEVEGSYTAQPVIVVIIDTATSVTAIRFTNNTNEDEIEVSQAFAAGDVLTIDCEQKSVTVNGVEVDYDGIFPELDIGINEFQIDVTGSAILYTATIQYRKTYL